MKLEQAQAIAQAFSDRISKGDTLSPADQVAYEAAKDHVDSILEQARAYSRETSLNAEDRVNQALGTAKKFWTPGRTIAAQVLGILVVATVSVFAGMRFERSRGTRSTNSLAGLGLTHDTTTLHPDSPQSHPATSPTDGRLAGNHAPRSNRSNANAAA